jgi:hypothetical protein
MPQLTKWLNWLDSNFQQTISVLIFYISSPLFAHF